MTDHRKTDEPKTEAELEEDYPLASPTELAGTTEGAIAAEFAARDAAEAIAEDAAKKDSEAHPS